MVLAMERLPWLTKRSWKPMRFNVMLAVGVGARIQKLALQGREHHLEHPNGWS